VENISHLLNITLQHDRKEQIYFDDKAKKDEMILLLGFTKEGIE
jgi:hypothetical protein